MKAAALSISILTFFTMPLAKAQVAYTYQGNAMGGPWEGGKISAKLMTGDVIPKNPTPTDFSAVQPCPGTWTFTIAVGNTLFDSKTADRSACYYLGSTGSDPLPAFLVLTIQKGDELSGTAVMICSHIHHRTYETLPCATDKRFLLGIRPPVSQDPNLDWVFEYEMHPLLNTKTAEYARSFRAQPGTWSLPKPVGEPSK